MRSAVDFVVRGNRRGMAWMAATAYLGGLAEALFLVAVTRAAFAITGGKDRIGIVAGWFLSVDHTLLLALSVVILRVSLAAFTSWRAAWLSTRVVARVRHRLASAFLDAAWETQESQRAGSLQELLTTFSGYASAMMTALNQGVVSTANLIALIGIAVAVEPLGALVLVVSVGILGLSLRPLRSLVRRRSHAAAVAGMDFATSVSEISELGMELHVFHVQDAARDRVDRLIDEAREKSRGLQFASGLSTPIYSGLAYLALLGALAIVAFSDTSSLTSLGASMLVMLRSLSYGQALQSAYTSVAGNVPGIEELRHRISLFENAERVDSKDEIESIGRITVDHVWFSYVEGEDVLRDISFTIEPHEIVGIVGPSGSGKSTLVQLLLGLRDPYRGRILANGRDLSEAGKEPLARKVTFVPQSARLVAGSIEDNIRFFRHGVSHEDVVQAAQLANLHHDVLSLPEGYDRQAGEHGGRLSGGQQQRLCIARALVEDPDVLIMDEPTSALDVRSEHLIRTTLLGLRERMAVIVIAHRLSTLDMCDRIMVIQDGELRGFDTPAALEKSNDFYREALALSGMR